MRELTVKCYKAGTIGTTMDIVRILWGLEDVTRVSKLGLTYENTFSWHTVHAICTYFPSLMVGVISLFALATDSI